MNRLADEEGKAGVVSRLAASAAFFLGLGGFFYAQFKRATNRPEHLFAASLAELQEDLRQLKAAADHESPAQ